MKKRPNVLWLMTDQHNANCGGFAGHPNVKTPNLDKVAANGVVFDNAYANNPICSPSRISFMVGQYLHTHGLFGNYHAEFPAENPDTLATVFRRYGYQTGLFGKSHMIRKWDEDGFEVIRYTDLCDCKVGDPTTTHYFKCLEERGLADFYEEGSIKPGMEYTIDGSGPARLPYEHSIEHYTGEETLKFLESRDVSRPFFVHMTFQRPHAPIAPAPEFFDMYDPEEMVLPDNAFDYFENRFAGKPKFMVDRLKNGCGYPLADPNPDRLKRVLASYYALISCIDKEIGRVLDKLEKDGELENTVIVFTADHGDFAGEHGLFHKNFGIYESIQRVPFLLSWPGGPKGQHSDVFVESVDLYPTLCEICDVPMSGVREGRSIPEMLQDDSDPREAVYCEWTWGSPRGKVSAIRTRDYRLVFYQGSDESELYDLRQDPGETRNVWHDEEYRQARLELTEQVFRFTLGYRTKSDFQDDRTLHLRDQYSPRELVHKGRRYWSRLKEVYSEEHVWPPNETNTPAKS
ncbi:sulfatase-like hydrolase/transferase [bacterium]|nr:sulfatase-like hydrolase/transferase [bacterium]